MTALARAEQALKDVMRTHVGLHDEYDPQVILRAVLTAIREPGKAAISAGITAAENVEDWAQDSYERYRVDSASDMPLPVWQAMIDAMLAEEG